MKLWNAIKEYGSLVRFSHTIFALPFALGAFAVASIGYFKWINLLGVLMCMVTARNSAMAYNRLVDADIDAENPRTKNRHLPTGQLEKRSVKFFIAINGLLFWVSAALFNKLTIIFAPFVWLLLLSYSHWKHWSWLCHWFLGFSIGLSPLGAWIAVRGEFALFPSLLGVFLMFWMGGFDIIYSTQDVEIDIKQGLKSVPVRFGVEKSLLIAMLSHALMLVVGVILWYLSAWHWALLLALFLSAMLLIYIHLFRKSNDLDAINRDFFLANGAISSVWLICLILWVIDGGVNVL
ncbi:MAG: UbiA family prenyltransferase [Fibrobacter sp.]|nr:UbiA family prenyltransferase [Fibrobacter sp.]